MARRSGRITLVVLASLAAAIGPAAAASACGYHRHAAPQHAPAHRRAPLIIGDSTMIYATPVLGRLGLEADAKECRQFDEGVAMLAARRHAHTLPSLAILALGANGPIASASIAQALAIMGPHRVLGLVTPRRSPESEAQMRRAAERYPDRVLLIDWVRHSAGHASWFAGDGLHVGFAGADAFARLVARAARPVIGSPPPSLHLPSATTGAKDCGPVHQAGAQVRVLVLVGTDRVSCTRARQLGRTPPLRPLAGWSAYDRPRIPGPPWLALYVRADRRAAVGVAPPVRE